jgi:hypothetical protein
MHIRTQIALLVLLAAAPIAMAQSTPPDCAVGQDASTPGFHCALGGIVLSDFVVAPSGPWPISAVSVSGGQLQITLAPTGSGMWGVFGFGIFGATFKITGPLQQVTFFGNGDGSLLDCYSGDLSQVCGNDLGRLFVGRAVNLPQGTSFAVPRVLCECGTFAPTWSFSFSSGCQVDDITHSSGIAAPIGLVERRIPANSQELFAQFTVNSSTTDALHTAAKSCGFIGFDWQQTVDTLYAPSHFFPVFPTLNTANRSPNGSMQAGQLSGAPPFYDAPPGGYMYEFPLNPFPFYYPATDALSPGASVQCVSRDPITGICVVPVLNADGTTLAFHDTPSEACLPGDGSPPSSETLLGRAQDGCGLGGIPNSVIQFTTSLVGIKNNDGMQGNLVCSQTYCASQPLYRWQWGTTYNGTSGHIYSMFNDFPPDPGSGTGRITITSINGVRQTPPAVSCTATPNTLWPPNGKNVLVAVSGTITAGTQTIPATGTTFAVSDDYRDDQPSGSVAVGADGSYSFTVPLIAARKGNDQEGRTYTINVIASDAIENVGSCAAVVTVPHDQGH